MLTRVLRIVLSAGIILWTTMPAWAFDYVLGDTFYTYSSQAQPAKGGSYVDATYNTSVTRFTSSVADHGRWGAQVEYSTWDTESSDGNYVLFQSLSDLLNASSYVVYTSTGGFVRTLDTQSDTNMQNCEPRWDRSGSHPSWIYYRTNKQLRYIDITDGIDHLVRDFSDVYTESGYYIWNGDEGTCSDDSRYWAFMYGNSNTNVTRVFTYDKQTNTIIGVQSTPSGNPPNSVSMSKSGSYVYIAYGWDGSGTWHDRPHIFPVSLSGNGYTACHTVPHGAWAYDIQGHEVYAYLNMFPSDDCIGFVRADNGQAYELYLQNNMGWNGSNVNFSAPGIDKKGWALCSTYSDSGYGYWSDNQIWMIELDETKTTTTSSHPRIWRLGPTQTYTGSNYYYQQPNASINTAGTRVYFGANWRNVNGNEEIYKIDLPATWYTDLGGSATPVPPTASASGTPASGNAPLTTSFSGYGTAYGTHTITGYGWTFGDGQTASTQNPSHTYTSTGTFTATLTVTDDLSQTDTDTVAITVTSPPLPESTANWGLKTTGGISIY